MRNSLTHHLLAGFLALVMIVALSALPGAALAENGNGQPPEQLTGDSLYDSTGSYGSTTTSGGQGTIASGIVLDALLLIVTTL